jgi:ABC-type uncharacterized transport system ATPase subunit
MNQALRTEGLSKRWGGFQANSDISIELAAGARHALIGPNGAGKTTFINLLTGVYEPSAGEVFLDGRKVTALPQHQRVKLGMTRTFQINTLFPGLTVLESVVLAIFERKGLASHWWCTVASRREEADEAMQLLALLHLEGDADRETRNLPTASSVWWRLRWRWPHGPSCCCWTSPQPGFRRPKAASCSASSTACRATSPSCSSSTTWAWSSASPSASRCWSAARC